MSMGISIWVLPSEIFFGNNRQLVLSSTDVSPAVSDLQASSFSSRRYRYRLARTRLFSRSESVVFSHTSFSASELGVACFKVKDWP